MAWFGNVSLGNFPDLSGAVTKLSESVKNIEKNFDSALGLEEKPRGCAGSAGSDGIWSSSSDSKILFKPVMAFMGHRGDDVARETLEKEESPRRLSVTEEHGRISLEVSSLPTTEVSAPLEKESNDSLIMDNGSSDVDMILKPNVPVEPDERKTEVESPSQMDTSLSTAKNLNVEDSALPSQLIEVAELNTTDESKSNNSNSTCSDGAEQVDSSILSVPNELYHVSDSEVSHDKQDPESVQLPNDASTVHHGVVDSENVSLETKPSVVNASDTTQSESVTEVSVEHLPISTRAKQDQARDPDSIDHAINASSESPEMGASRKELEVDNCGQSKAADSTIELEKLRKEMKLTEAALHGAARQAQVYALTRERDTLRREQSKKSDTAAILKEKDEIINQVMAEGRPEETRKPNRFLYKSLCRLAAFLILFMNTLDKNGV